MNELRGNWSFIIRGGKIYTASYAQNGLFEVDYTEGTARLLAKTSEEPLWKGGHYAISAKAGESTLFFPGRNSDIAILYSNEVVKRIELPGSSELSDKAYGLDNKFFCAYGNEDYIIAFGGSLPLIVHIDLKADRIFYVSDFPKTRDRDQNYFMDGAAELDGKIYAPMGNIPAIYEYDPLKKVGKPIYMPKKVDAVESLTVEDGIFYMVTIQNGQYSFVSWDIKRNEMKTVRMPYEGKTELWAAFHKPIICKDEIFLFPVEQTHVLKTDRQMRTVKPLLELDKTLPFGWRDQAAFMVTSVQRDNKNIFYVTADYKWHIYDTKTEKCETKSIVIKDDWYVKEFGKDTLRYRIKTQNNLVEESIFKGCKEPVKIFIDQIRERV